MAPRGHRRADPQVLRGVPIARRADRHLCHKLDREARHPFDLLDEIEQSLARDMTPASWPIGMGRDFLGTYDLSADALLLFERGVHDRVTEPVRCSGLYDPKLPRLLPKEALAKLRGEMEILGLRCGPQVHSRGAPSSAYLRQCSR